MTRGWWSIEIEGFRMEELSDVTKEHIAQQIKNGCVQGEILEEEDEKRE